VADAVGDVVADNGPLLDAAPATETPATPRTAATDTEARVLVNLMRPSSP
jgi:hypothetical protein